MSLYVLGDPHFSANRPWRLSLGKAFLSWFETFIPKDNSSLLVLGDYCDDAVNPGKVIKQLKAFVRLVKSKFSNVYFLVGNHDLKLYREQPHISFEFVEDEDIHILQEPGEVLEIEGLHVLSLPFYNYRLDVPPMKDYYSNLPDSIKGQHFDVVFGHFTDTSVMVFDNLIDISYLDTSYTCLGHQHIRISPNYIGSVFPCKISENFSPEPRAIWVFDKLKSGEVKKSEIHLPKFGEYKTIEYPKPIEKSENIVIWTISNCESEKIARDFYGDIFIRSVSSNENTKGNTNSPQVTDAFALENALSIFNEMLKSSEVPLSRPVVSTVRSLLQSKNIQKTG